MLLSRKIRNKLFCVTANIQKCMFSFKERSTKASLISVPKVDFLFLFYLLLCEASLWVSALTVFSNTSK